MKKACMTYKRLAMYGQNVLEQRILQEEIAEIRGAVPQLMDTVEGSMPQHPYVLHKIIVGGVDPVAAEEAERRAQSKIARGAEIGRELDEVERYVADVKDALTRRIMQLHFIRGLSWRRASTSAYGSPGMEDAARKRVKRHLDRRK